jgi:hypothetical protein
VRRRASKLALDHSPRSTSSTGSAHPLRAERTAHHVRSTGGAPASAAPDAHEDRAVFTPDIVLPEQFLSAFRVAGPEGRLMLAVLKDAINCYRRYASAQDPAGCQLFADVDEWVKSVDRTSPFTFENICDAFDISPEWVRRHLLAGRRRDRHSPPRRAAIAAPPRGARRGAAIAAPPSRVRARAAVTGPVDLEELPVGWRSMSLPLLPVPAPMRDRS